MGLGAQAGERPVGSAAELYAAVTVARPGTRLVLAPGEYEIDRPLVVPDDVALNGGGRMQKDAAGRAAGFAPGRLATLRITGRWSGYALSLGDGSELRGLKIVDESDRAMPPPADRNVIGVVSRRPADRVSAIIRDCEIETDQSTGAGREGPLGRGVVVMTANPRDRGPAHVDSRVALRLESSVVRAPRGNALFAINFAARGRVELRIRDSEVIGSMAACGGAPRPDPVSGARTLVDSGNNHYAASPDNPRLGWRLIGGSGVAHPIGETPPGAEENQLVVRSLRDRMEGYRIGVVAAGGARVGGLSGPSSGNRAELLLRDFTVATAGEGAADFELAGARAEAHPDSGPAQPPGEGNVLQVRFEGVRGSGLRANRYADVDGPALSSALANGNRLELEGDPRAFSRDNAEIMPGPPRGSFR